MFLVPLKQPLCCHSVGEILCEIIQYVIYQRGQTPALVQELLSDSEAALPKDLEVGRPDGGIQTNKEIVRHSKQKRFVFSFLNLEKAIRGSFRSANQRLISAAALVFGPSLTNMTEMYLIDFAFCACGSESSAPCVPLSRSVLQLVVRSMLNVSMTVELKELGQTRFFFLTKAHRSASLDKFYPKPGPELMVVATRARCTTVRIRLCHSTCQHLVADVEKLTMNDGRVTEATAGSGDKAEQARTAGCDRLDAAVAEENDFIWFQYDDVLCGFS